MAWQQTPLSWPLLATAFLLFMLTLYTILQVWQNRTVPAVGALIAFFAGAAQWTIAYAYQLSNTAAAPKLLWFQLGATGSIVVTLAWFAFAADITDRTEWLSVPRLAPLVGVGLIFFLGILTNEAHGLFWADPTIVERGGLRYLSLSFRPLYVVVQAYFVGLALFGIYLLATWAREQSRGTVRDVSLLGIAAAVPILANTKYHLGVGPWEAVNFTPITLLVPGVVMAVVAFRSSSIDVTPIARASVFESMHEGFLVLDRHDRVRDANPAAHALLSLSADVLDSPAEAVLPADGQFAEHDRTASFQWTSTPDDSDQFQVFQFSVSPLESSRYAGRLVLIRDVTERELVERRYQSLIEESSELITVLDTDGVIQYVSPSVQRLHGVDPSSLEGSAASTVFEPVGEESFEELFERATAAGSNPVRFEHRLSYLDPDRTFDAVGRDLFADQFVEGFVLTTREITARKDREQELERINEQLDRFADVLSHDLRNPLEVANIHTSLAKRGEEESLETVERALGRMDEMIENILTLARGDPTEPELTDIALAQPARRAWETVRTDGASLTIAESPTIRADEARLVRLFENLFRNAVEHTDGEVTVTVGTTADGFFVADTGDGLPDGDRATLFEFGETREDQGTGMGLAIVKEIAAAHGWEVVATNGERGARFEFRGVETV
jgi:PAS domain S-box-containing protein